MFITFEGIDGSGKSTQIKLLKRKLEEHDHTVVEFREPGGTPLAEEIRTILLDSDFEIDPVTELLLFSSARSNLINERVIPLLEDGKTVILDRYYDSTTAYQGFGRSSAPMEQIRQLNSLASHQLEPDLTFYLRIGLLEAEKRIGSEQRDRMERSGKKFFKRVIDGFDRLAEEEGRIITIDATLPADQIHQQVWHHVTFLLSQS